VVVVALFAQDLDAPARDGERVPEVVGDDACEPFQALVLAFELAAVAFAVGDVGEHEQSPGGHAVGRERVRRHVVVPRTAGPVEGQDGRFVGEDVGDLRQHVGERVADPVGECGEQVAGPQL